MIDALGLQLHLRCENAGRLCLGAVGELSSDVECAVAWESSPLECSLPPSAGGSEPPLAKARLPICVLFLSLDCLISYHQDRPLKDLLLTHSFKRVEC